MADFLEALNSLAPIVAASAGIVGSLAALAKAAPRVKRMLGVTDQTRTIILLREKLDETKELADIRSEMIDDLRAQLEDERAERRADRGRLEAALEFSRQTADDLRRRLREREA